MADGGSSLFVKHLQHSFNLNHSGSSPGIATGTFIGCDTNGVAVAGNASSGSAQVAALGFALIGENMGTWTTTSVPRFDAVDCPTGFAEVNSGSYNPGQILFLASGSSLVNYSTTAPSAHGELVQPLGVMETSTRFRIKIGHPQILSGSPPLLMPFGTAVG